MPVETNFPAVLTNTACTKQTQILPDSHTQNTSFEAESSKYNITDRQKKEKYNCLYCTSDTDQILHENVHLLEKLTEDSDIANSCRAGH